MAEQNRKVGKHEAFETVLSTADSAYQLNSEGKNKSSTKMGVKKRKKDVEKTNLKSNNGAKKKKETAKDRMLEMNSFYSNNTFGIWIQCTKCDKWRKVMEYEEEHEVPENWCCSMSISGTKSCDEPEDTKDADCSPVNFIPGAIVWAKYNGYPWWPAMIEDDPDIEEYYWMEKSGKHVYHVSFLDDKVTRAWVPGSFVRHYLDPPRYRYQSASNSKYSPKIAEAEIRAKRAINMPIQQRLEIFSFAQRYKGKWGSPLRFDNSDENGDERDLTQMLLEEVNDIESSKSTDSDCRSVSPFELKENEIDKESGYCKISSKNNLVNNVECKKSLEKRNKLLAKKQFKKENKSPNDDDTAAHKEKSEEVKPLNKQTGEKDFHLDEVIPNTTEIEDSKSLISQNAKEVNHTHLKSVDKKTPTANKNISTSVETPSEDCLVKVNSKNRKTNALTKSSKAMNKVDKLKNLDEKICSTEGNEEGIKSSSVKTPTASKNISTSVETPPEDCLVKVNSKNRKTNALTKTSKAMNKADKLKNLDEKICSTEENEEGLNSSSVKKNIEKSKIMNPTKKKNSREKTNNSSNSKFNPPLKKNKNHASESQISEGMDDDETAGSINLCNLDSTIKEQKHEENKMAEKNQEENKQLTKAANAKCSSMGRKACDYVKETENNKTIEKNLRSENKFKKNNVVKILKKNLKSSLENKHASLEESKNHASNDSGTTFSKEKKQDNKRKEKNNLAENLTSLEAKDKSIICIKKSKRATTVSQQKAKIMKVDSLTRNLPVPENSKLMDRSKLISKQITEKKSIKIEKTEIGKEEQKQKQENEIILVAGDDNTVQEISCNEDANKENFSLSVEMNLEELKEEDSDPFEAE